MIKRRQPALEKAKLRAAKRAREDGGVIFIVAMTLAVLAALGAYALKSAAMEVRTAGFERQNTQTHYLSEYGVLGVMQNMSPDTAQLYLNFMMSASQRDNGCTSLQGMGYVAPTDIGKACRRMGATELAGAWPQLGSTNPPIAPYAGGNTTAPGSLGIIPLTGDFYTEITEPTQASMATGNSLNNGYCFVQFTVSSYGMTQPSNTGGSTIAAYAGEGIETARARLIGGPVKFAGCGSGN